jgi:hypothetical protein
MIMSYELRGAEARMVLNLDSWEAKLLRFVACARSGFVCFWSGYPNQNVIVWKTIQT